MGEQAILVAVGDQLARTLPDQSGDEKLLCQDHRVFWDSPPRAPSCDEVVTMPAIGWNTYRSSQRSLPRVRYTSPTIILTDWLVCMVTLHNCLAP
jgi:hypothetical protein